MDLQAATDELYGLSPDDFVARRTELVAQARAEKDRALAKEIGQLRRPTRNGWLVNVLARRSPAKIEALLALGGELAAAQQRMAGDDLRRLSAQRRTSVDALAGEAIRLGAELGYSAPESARQDISQSLQAALGDPEVAELVRRGRLVQAVTYGGFGLGGDLMAALAASAGPGATAPTAEPDPDAAAEAPAGEDQEAARRVAEQAEAESAEQERAERERAEQQAEAEQDEAARKEAEREADEATARADELADRVEELRQALREAEAAERVAREDARNARKRAAALRR